MTRNELYSALRLRIGDPRPADVPDRHLSDYLNRGLEWLQSELQYAETSTSAALTLAADTQEYELPDDLVTLLFVDHAGKSLTPRSVQEWERENVDWRGADAGTPREYALLGRKILFYPTPDADAVSTDASPLLRYYRTSPGHTASGTPQLGDADQMLAVYHAALEYLGLHPERDPTGRMATTNQGMLQQLLPAAKRRAEQRVVNHYPAYLVESRRGGAAR